MLTFSRSASDSPAGTFDTITLITRLAGSYVLGDGPGWLGSTFADSYRDTARAALESALAGEDGTLPTTLVLFVHGLAGDETTWGGFEALLAADADLRGRVVVDFFKYMTKRLRLLPRWRSVPIQDLAKALDTFIRFKHPGARTVVLVCHSMGGLIGRRYLVDAERRGEARPVKELVLFATPHDGASLASAGAALSFGHRHLGQTRVGSDMLESINEDWTTLRVAAKVAVTNVVAGQDAHVSRQSAFGAIGVRPEIIPDKGHSAVCKPTTASDLAFLIVKRACLRAATDWAADLTALRKAVCDGEENAVQSLVVNRGRSWIETADLNSAVSALNEVVNRFGRDSLSAVFAHYLVAIARLFKDRSVAGDPFDEAYRVRAASHGLEALAVSERMEFARKRGDLDGALEIATAVGALLDRAPAAAPPIVAYGLGVAQFLLGNLLRFGGRYDLAARRIEGARGCLVPAVLSHQIELVHCRYADAVCRLMRACVGGEEPRARLADPALSRFAENLVTLTGANDAWLSGDLGSAVERANVAALAFEQIGFADYAKRAETLSSLLQAWRLLEFGAPASDAARAAGGEGERLRGVLGDGAAVEGLRTWLPTARPSRVLGLLQFAATYNTSWGDPIGRLELPPILAEEGGRLVWRRESCASLREAEAALRGAMNVARDVRLPLIVD